MRCSHVCRITVPDKVGFGKPHFPVPTLLGVYLLVSSACMYRESCGLDSLPTPVRKWILTGIRQSEQCMEEDYLVVESDR